METLRELRFDHSYTQKMLADEAGITRHAVLRMEQHVYPTPLPQVITALSQITSIPESELEAIYLQEVRDNRIDSGRAWAVGTVTEYIFQFDEGNQHPFITFRTRLADWTGHSTSAIQFCIAFSIHPSTLAEYENYKTHYPKSISIALTEAGLPDNITAVLHNSQRFNMISD